MIKFTATIIIQKITNMTLELDTPDAVTALDLARAYAKDEQEKNPGSLYSVVKLEQKGNANE